MGFQREPKVIVGVRQYYNDEGSHADVEVFADNPKGRELAESFSKADAGLCNTILHENVKLTAAGDLSQAYDPRANLEPSSYRGLDHHVQWLVDNVDPDEAYRILLCSRAPPPRLLPTYRS